MQRSMRRVALVGMLIVSGGLSLGMAWWGYREALPRIGGTLGLVAGLVLLTSRNLVRREPDFPRAVQDRAQHEVVMRMRMMGISGILMGAALLIPDEQLRLPLILSAAIASVAGALKRPRRLFTHHAVSTPDAE